MGLMVIPYIDINPKGNGYYTFKERKYEIMTFVFGFHVLWVSTVIIGTFLRGPGWNWFWPWEPQPWEPGMYEVALPYQLGTAPSSQDTSSSLLCVGPGCASTGVGISMEVLSWGQTKARYSHGLSTGR